MYNQMPYLNGMNTNNMQGGAYPEMIFERLNNRISRLEKQVRILENRVNNLNSTNPSYLKNNYDDSDNMYML